MNAQSLEDVIPLKAFLDLFSCQSVRFVRQRVFVLRMRREHARVLNENASVHPIVQFRSLFVLVWQSWSSKVHEKYNVSVSNSSGVPCSPVR